MYLLGIDIGTTNWKAVLYACDGTPVAQSAMPTITHHGDGGRAVYEADEIWQGVCCLLRDILQQGHKPDAIAGVTITGMGEALVPLDKEQRILYPVIAWYDSRTEPQYRWLVNHDRQAKYFQITGLPHNPIYSLNKLLWMKEHEPDIFKRTAMWLTMPDFIMFKLSGEYATDYSEACRTLCFDVKQRQWAPEILALLEVDSSVFPTPYPSGTVIGQVHQQANRETGLAPGTPVVTGGHDHICGALAAGVFEEGVVLDSCGTTESLVMSLKTLNLTDVPPEKQLTYGCHVARDTYYMISGMYAAGVELQWYKEQFEGKAYGRITQGEVSEEKIWEGLMAEARQTPPGAEGVFFLPHSRGSNNPPVDPFSRGALLGLRSYHHRGHILRAVVEGLCYEIRRLLSLMEEQSGVPVNLLRVVGSARNTFWLQVKANVLNKCLELPQITEGTSLGAAMLAGIGTGVYRDEADAFRHVYRPGKIYEPQPEHVQWHDRWYREVFLQIYPTLAPVYHTIAKVYDENPSSSS